MAAEGKRKGVPALGWWLMLVGSLRLASVWFGFFDIWALRVAVFSQTEMTDVHGRTFGVWTLLTCTLCFLCALNLENRPLYLATFLSFIYALGHFLTEYLIYHTMPAANLSTVGFFAGSYQYLTFAPSAMQCNAMQHLSVRGFQLSMLQNSFFCSLTNDKNWGQLNLKLNVDNMDASAVEFSWEPPGFLCWEAVMTDAWVVRFT
ncbi:Ergosterol biosynthetic protein 28 [Zea mays]|uniref:Ergosterol biosynthetic protein 28 n=2 Tax=Andropogoneae TaxID=147429 RepID=A0A317YB42_MAIZE|nr:Ergosterol biosynthetic protein 28 [Zea mays]